MVCAKFVTDSGSFVIIPAHSAHDAVESWFLRQQTLTRTYADCSLGLKILVSAVQSRPSPPFHFCVDSYLHAADFQQLARHTFRLGRNLADHARLGASLIGMTVRSPG